VTARGAGRPARAGARTPRAQDAGRRIDGLEVPGQHLVVVDADPELALEESDHAHDADRIDDSVVDEGGVGGDVAGRVPA
jgi:hypothetical protein